LQGRPSPRAILAIALFLCAPVPVLAQAVQISPIEGYRFNGDLFELATNRPVDVDGAPIAGGAVNVDLGGGLWFEGLFTHQHADITTPSGTFGPAARWRVEVDQALAGGRQEFGTGRARTFLTGLLGFTRYGVQGDHEIRFTVGAGGGVLVPIQRRLGVRFDGRLLTTFVDGDAHVTVCGGGGCLVGLHLDVAWQAEFTAGLVVIF
jgi:hypothetical protein